MRLSSIAQWSNGRQWCTFIVFIMKIVAWQSLFFFSLSFHFIFVLFMSVAFFSVVWIDKHTHTNNTKKQFSCRITMTNGVLSIYFVPYNFFLFVTQKEKREERKKKWNQLVSSGQFSFSTYTNQKKKALNSKIA